MKRLFRIASRLLVAICIATLVLNLICFFYSRPVGWIERTESATDAIWNPGKLCIQSKEGVGVYRVDHNGYLNPDKPLGEFYTLVVGASFVAGQEVKSGERYTDILNSRLAISDNELAVYNCAQDGYLLTDIIRGFYAITNEFPDAKNIVLDVGTSDFTEEDIRASMNQHGFDETQLGRNIVPTLTFKKRLVMKVKETFPLLSNLKNQIESFKGRSTNEEKEIDVSSYLSAMNEALRLIRFEFDGNLIVLYHPPVQIEQDGTMSLVESKTYHIFAQLCQNNGIVFVDMSDSFMNTYEKEYAVPYGFLNTAVGKGHISVAGHRMIADELFRVLTDLDGQGE